jgi:carbon-monoxide dehydrogenase medium subunit
MKPARFELFSPRTTDEVLERLAHFGDDARILAGGQSLVPLLNMRMARPRALISINQCKELAYIRRDDKVLSIGALVRQSEAERSEEARLACPLLARALPWVGCTANRNRGTVCGSLAHADPIAELPAVAVALGAEFVIAGRERRYTVDAEAFFVSELATCIQPGEMLEAVRLPISGYEARAAFVEVGNRAHGFAIAGVAAQLHLGAHGKCVEARIAAIGAGPTAVRLKRAEAVLIGEAPCGEVLRAAAAAARAEVDPAGNLHADAAYRKELIGTLVQRAVAAAQGSEAGGLS